jgi:hypothetical protein
MDNNLLYLDSKITGSDNYIPMYSGSTYLTSSVMYQLGGNVGIGTINPSGKLQVVGGSITTAIADAYNTCATRFDLANPAISLGIGYVAADIPMLQGFNNLLNIATDITINPFGGNVGIGTTTPNSKLEVVGTTTLTGTTTITGSLNISGSTITATGSLRVFSPTLSSEIRGNNSINLTSTTSDINLTAASGVNISGDLSGGNIYSNRKVKIGNNEAPNRQLEITNSGSLAPTIRLNNTSSNSYYDIANAGNLFINRNESISGVVIASGSGGGSTVFTTSSIVLEAGVVDTYTTTNFGAGTYNLTYYWDGGDDISILDGSPTGSVLYTDSIGAPLTSSFTFTTTNGYITFRTDGFTSLQVNFSLITIASFASSVRVGINKASGSAVNATGLDISGSLVVSGSTLITDVLTLPPVNPLPSGRPTGSLAVSGSGTACKIYFFNGSWNALF